MDLVRLLTSNSSTRCLSQLPRKLPNKQECRWSAKNNNSDSVYSNAHGNCPTIWNTASRNCRKTGDRSSDRVEWSTPCPHRSWNLCPNAHHSFSISMASPSMVRKCGSRINCATEQICAVRSQPSEQCTNTLAPSKCSFSAARADAIMINRTCLSQPDSSILAKKPPADPSIIWMDSFTLDCTLVWLLSASANTAADCRMMWMLSMLQNINSVFGYREGSSVPLPTAMLRVAATLPLASRMYNLDSWFSVEPSSSSLPWQRYRLSSL
mmetsp:Transcript_17019/g.37167  ORF Transcript_17019/g.37167 Transcript_17019/m.37167 type:complete len:267 (-) Transcript_17019:1494-2294(-)